MERAVELADQVSIDTILAAHGHRLFRPPFPSSRGRPSEERLNRRVTSWRLRAGGTGGAGRWGSEQGTRMPALEAEILVERGSLFGQGVDEQAAHTDAVGGGERREDRVAYQKSSQAGAVRVGVDGEASHQYGGDGVWRVATYLARKVGMLDRYSR